jgi:hypothetical protein
VPASADLRQVLESLQAEGEEVYVTDLGKETTAIVVRKWVPGEGVAERAASDLRVDVAERLKGLRG